MLSVYSKRESNGHTSGPLHLDESTDLIVNLSAGFSETTIIIDALDECNRDTRRALFSMLKQIVDLTKNVRIFLTGRCDGDIKRMLCDFPSHYIDATDNTKDIEIYINSEIEQCFKEGRLPEEGDNLRLKSDIISVLVKGAKGM